MSDGNTETLTDTSSHFDCSTDVVEMATGSVAANWIEADEAPSKKDFLMRLKICRKEANESRLFLRLGDAGFAKSNVVARETLTTEARELTLIFSSIISKSG